MWVNAGLGDAGEEATLRTSHGAAGQLRLAVCLLAQSCCSAQPNLAALPSSTPHCPHQGWSRYAQGTRHMAFNSGLFFIRANAKTIDLLTRIAGALWVGGGRMCVWG